VSFVIPTSSSSAPCFVISLFRSRFKRLRKGTTEEEPTESKVVERPVEESKADILSPELSAPVKSSKSKKQKKKRMLRFFETEAEEEDDSQRDKEEDEEDGEHLDQNLEGFVVHDEDPLIPETPPSSERRSQVKEADLEADSPHMRAVYFQSLMSPSQDSLPNAPGRVTFSDRMRTSKNADTLKRLEFVFCLLFPSCFVCANFRF
jgi:hypothetical protein